jgi:hypothetical protein
MTGVLMVIGAGQVQAQATRTWVSGVGDDANPCSRTAPCKTFAGAISKTAAGGEINALDPGGFGAVTITKSISIEADGVMGGVLAAGTNGIIINAGANDVVTLRGLTIDGIGTGLNGIRFLAGGSLHVIDCTIANFTGKGIDFQPSGTSSLFVTSTSIKKTAGAVHVVPQATGSATGTLDRVSLNENTFGLRVEDRSELALVDSTISENATHGIFVRASAAGPAHLSAVRSKSTGNGAAGVRSEGSGAVARLDGMLITKNNGGMIAASGGAIISFRNNSNDGNGTNGGPTATVTQQ